MDTRKGNYTVFAMQSWWSKTAAGTRARTIYVSRPVSSKFIILNDNRSKKPSAT